MQKRGCYLPSMTEPGCPLGGRGNSWKRELETMKLRVNGEAYEFQGDKLMDLIQSLGLENLRFAIAINRQVIPRSEISQTLLQENDEVEIVQAVGGG